MKKTLQDLLDEANAVVKALTIEETQAVLAEGSAVFVDLREESERVRNGIIPGALHVPRGLFEWAVDQDTTYTIEAFDTDQLVVLYCSHGLRSAMSAKLAQEMGASNVAHLSGGFTAWKSGGGETEPYSGV